MSAIVLEIPESVLALSGQSREEFEREARLLLAVGLFASGRLSSGRAAELAGVPRVEFLFLASMRGVPVADLDAEELDREFGAH